MTPRYSALALSTALLALACGGAEKPPAAAPSTTVDASYGAIVAAPPRQAKALTAKVHVSEDIRRACGLNSSEAYFDYDSSRVRSEERELLWKLAVCFTSGPLKGRMMALVGHADPRGDGEYNLLLGERRATSVALGLEAERMSRAQMQTTSRGEMDATGSDEQSWAHDRRVDVLLAN
jgi:peptidoglycan-associated lipoprotein